MMKDNYERIGALTGLASVLLVIVGFVIVLPKPPAPDASVIAYSNFYKNHTDEIRASVAIISVALGFYVWFLGSLSAALRAAMGNPRLPTVAFGGGMVGAMFFVITLTATATAAYRPGETSPELVRLLSDIGYVVAAPAAAGFFVRLAATALVILRTTLLPSWLGWVSLAGAIANLGGVFVIFTTSGALAADGVVGLFLPIVGFLVPIAALSVVIAQKSSGDTLGGKIGGAVDRVTGQLPG
jgi:hypothetical protein